jgi:hypothetical protein
MQVQPWFATFLLSWTLKSMGSIFGSPPIGLLYFIGTWTLDPHLKWPLFFHVQIQSESQIKRLGSRTSRNDNRPGLSWTGASLVHFTKETPPQTVQINRRNGQLVKFSKMLANLIKFTLKKKEKSPNFFYWEKNKIRKKKTLVLIHVQIQLTIWKTLPHHNFQKWDLNSTGHNKKKKNCWENRKDSAPHTLILLFINHFTE